RPPLRPALTWAPAWRAGRRGACRETRSFRRRCIAAPARAHVGACGCQADFAVHIAITADVISASPLRPRLRERRHAGRIVAVDVPITSDVISASPLQPVPTLARARRFLLGGDYSLRVAR